MATYIPSISMYNVHMYLAGFRTIVALRVLAMGVRLTVRARVTRVSVERKGFQPRGLSGRVPPTG